MCLAMTCSVHVHQLFAKCVRAGACDKLHSGAGCPACAAVDQQSLLYRARPMQAADKQPSQPHPFMLKFQQLQITV